MSEFDSFTVQPERITTPDTIGVYALPINATPQNTGDRLMALASRVGFPFVAIDYLNQGRAETSGLPAQEANQPAGDIFEQMSERRAAFRIDKLRPFGAENRILGMGDSLGVPTIQGIALRESPLFHAILLRDGWNLGRPTDAVRGIGRYGIYQVRNFLNDRRHPRSFDIPATHFSTQPPLWPSETGILQKLVNVAPMMMGGEAQANALTLAEKATIPLHIVLFGNGLSGGRSPWSNGQFRADLLMAPELSELPEEERKPLKITVEPQAWHSDLLDPALASKHVKTTLGLVR